MITVLRLGHRRGRDDRISTHVGLTARQFGADRIIYAGEKDSNMLESLDDVCDRWGGSFQVSYRKDFRTVIKEFDGCTVHLTMYGQSFHEAMASLEDDVQEEDDLLVVVGSQKVPRDVYELVDYNIGVGNQPHSEVAAVAVFLYELADGLIPDSFEGGDIRVVQDENAKNTAEEL